MILLCNMTKLMGIDYGTKRVGIALSDDGGHLAFPYKVLPQNKDLVQKIKNICVSEGVNVIIIGESLKFNQKENPIMPAVRALKSRLEKELSLSVYLEPEMLTTQEARRPPEQEEKTRRRQRLRRGNARKPSKPEYVDARAAALILQSYIDRATNYGSRNT